EAVRLALAEEGQDCVLGGRDGGHAASRLGVWGRRLVSGACSLIVTTSNPLRHPGGKMRRGRILIVAMALLIAACSNGGTTTTEGPSLSGELLVSAAASLTDAFAEVGEAFNEVFPDVNVVFNFGPSSGLREQIIEGAPADVFASANTSNMD